MASIKIIVGTVMGTALEVAEAVQGVFQSGGHATRIITAFTPRDLEGGENEVLLICTSNTGMGDLPQNIVPFYTHLTCHYPRLAGRCYGLINLGDSSYPNFAEAGRSLDHAMLELGALRLGEPLVLDAIYVDDPAGEAQTWAREWMRQL